ncbi:hypothetical protein [Pseudomonas sp.]|nr:hypothetical protein [Pseudomonas sp.]
MTQKTKRDDAGQKKPVVGDVGERHKKLNQQGEQPRPTTPPDSKEHSAT